MQNLCSNPAHLNVETTVSKAFAAGVVVDDVYRSWYNEVELILTIRGMLQEHDLSLGQRVELVYSILDNDGLRGGMGAGRTLVKIHDEGS